MPGPYVQVAAFVENTALDKTSGTLSLFGIFDKITAVMPPGTPTGAPPPASDEEVTVVHPCSLVVTLKGGGWSGDAQLRVLRDRPGTDPEVVTSKKFTMPSAEDAGINLIARMHRPLTLRPGLNWFRVLVDSNELTRIPLSFEITHDAPPG